MYISPVSKPTYFVSSISIPTAQQPLRAKNLVDQHLPDARSRTVSFPLKSIFSNIYLKFSAWLFHADLCSPKASGRESIRSSVFTIASFNWSHPFCSLTISESEVISKSNIPSLIIKLLSQLRHLICPSLISSSFISVLTSTVFRKDNSSLWQNGHRNNLINSFFIFKKYKFL